MLYRLSRLIARSLGIIAIIIATIYLARAFDSRRMPDLEIWHRVSPDNEFTADQAGAGVTLDDYLEREERVFAELREIVSRQTSRNPSRTFGRYAPGNMAEIPGVKRDWNRTVELVPERVKGGVLLLHGLTDSPYSMRRIAQSFFEQGFYVLILRIPGHGTTPAALLSVSWQDWLAAVRIGARRVREKAGKEAPFHIGGYSNGGALAVKYTLESLESDDIATPDRLFLFSPALGVSRFGKLANWHALISFISFFEKFKWQSIFPEYDPFKYNSFPKNAGDQTYRLTINVAAQVDRLAASGKLGRFPPVLTFQSLVDSTVLTTAIIDRLYRKLPDNGSELVLFDVNRFSPVKALLKPNQVRPLEKLIAGPRMRYGLTVITNASPTTPEVVAKHRSSRAAAVTTERLRLAWPRDVYSLSHVAIPFPPDDPVYGRPSEARPGNRIPLGGVAPRGERNLLRVPIGQLMRLRYNPFFGYIEARLTAALQGSIRERSRSRRR